VSVLPLEFFQQYPGIEIIRQLSISSILQW